MPVVNDTGNALTGSTGTGSFVGSTSPVLVTPALGTPSSGTLTNCTGLPVAGGGTGLTATTAYAVLCGGTTTTGALQSIASVGTASQVLTSNGAGALPTFQTASAGGTGSVVQIVTQAPASANTGTSSIPIDTTIPQSSEGVEYTTLSITPTNTNNKLIIEFSGGASPGSGTLGCVIALFQDSGADAICCSIETLTASQSVRQMSLRHIMTAGTTSSTTFKIRYGTGGTGTMYLGTAVNNSMGGTLNCTFTITEVKA